MSIVALVLATLHAIGHLSGLFVFGSMPSRQQNLAVSVGQDRIPRAYIDYIRSLPGWTGLTALGCFHLPPTMSMPLIRKWSYEVFQLGHLLVFPIIGLMMAHGTLGLLQWPMLGYWLAFSTVLVILERTLRLVLGFCPILTDLEILDDETVVVTANVPKHRLWQYKAGQYIFVQVPQISFLQWHPFTISTCSAQRGHKTAIKIGLVGPFGATAQRFYDLEYSMVVGAGIGVTPYSGVLTDLQTHELERNLSGENTIDSSDRSPDPSPYAGHRRVDFHWMVRDKNNLLWSFDLLNEVSRAQDLNRSHLDIRLQTYVTPKRKEISTHVFRWLLEKHRTDSHPQSPLTGLLNPTHFGRPELGIILEEHYEDMSKVLARRTSGGEKAWKGKDDEVKVGMFFCGPPVIGQQLDDRCAAMTARGRNEGRKVEYHVIMEVLG